MDRDDRRPAHEVVGGGHGHLVGARHRHREEIAGAYVPGQRDVGGEDVARLAVAAHHRGRDRSGGGDAADQAGCVAGPVQGGPGVVAHAPVDGDEQRPAGVLDGEDAVQRHPGRGRDRPPRLDDQARHGQPRDRAARGEFGGEAAREGGRIERGLARPVGDAVAAAQVEFGEGDAVALVYARHQPDHAAHGHQVRLHVGDLGADVAVQPGQFEGALTEHPGDGVLRRAVREGQAELLVLGSGTDLLVAARRHPGHHPHHHLLAAGGPGERGDPGDLRGAVDDDPADAQPERGREVAGRLRVAVQHHALGREPGGVREVEFTGRTDVQAEPLLVDPAHYRPAQERLGRVQDVGCGEGRAVGPAPGPYLVLVHHVGGGVEAVGGLGEGDPADAQVPVREPGRGGRPDGEVVRRGGEAGGQKLGHDGDSSGAGNGARVTGRRGWAAGRRPPVRG